MSPLGACAGAGLGAASEKSALLGGPAELAGDVATVLTVLKAIMGAGGFAMPWAFARAGLVGGSLAISLVAGLSVVTIFDLGRLKRRTEEHCGLHGASYVDVARATLGTRGAQAVYAMALTSALGGLSAYLVYIASTMNSLVPRLSQTDFVLLAAGLLLPVTWLDSFSFLARMAQVGTFAVVAGYIVTVGYAVNTREPWASPGADGVACCRLFAAPGSTASAFGSMAFLFCTHFVLFPIMTASRASAAREPGGFELLACIAFGLAALINGAFGAVGLVYFGPDVSSIVLNEIASESIGFTITKVLMCVDLMCSFPLVFKAASQIVEDSLGLSGGATGAAGAAGAGGAERALKDGEASDLQLPQALLCFPSEAASRVLVRSLLVAASVAISFIGDFGAIISIVGSLSLASLAFVLPPIMALHSGCCQEDGPPRLRRAASLATLLLGLALVGAGTFATLARIFEAPAAPTRGGT